MQLIDAAIIGGGPAGLSAALVLGRARKNVLVIDEERPRNRVTLESHGFLTRDGISPGEFRRVAKEQIAAYPSVRFVADKAVGIAGGDGNFQITTARGKAYRSKKLLFAVGKKDAPLDIDGLAEVYGKSAFVCPYCDGWELRDQPLVLIARGKNALHMAKTLAGWTKKTVICSNGPHELTADQRRELRRHHVPVYDAPIQTIRSKNGMAECVVLKDGSNIACTGIFFTPRLIGGSTLPRALGCKMTNGGSVMVDRNGKTSIPGVYSAGDAAADTHKLITAASMGSIAAVGINGELLTEAWNRLNDYS